MKSPRPQQLRVDYSRRFLLFIPVETRRSRRTLVVGFYLGFIAFAILFLWIKGAGDYDHLIPLSFFFSALLGGILYPGPVRLFSSWQYRLRGVPDRPADLAGVQLARDLPPSRSDPAYRLDEHDIARRDRAHYLAYSALRWPAILAVGLGLMFYMDWLPAHFAHVLLLIAPPLALLFFSLPQAILLWTEPDLDPDPQDPPPQTVIRIVP